MNRVDSNQTEESEDNANEHHRAARRIAWENSLENARSRRVRWLLIAIYAVVAISEVIYYDRKTHSSFFNLSAGFTRQWLPYYISILIFAAFCVILSSNYTHRQERLFDDRQLIAKQRVVERAESRLAESGNLDLPSLWKVTNQRLDYYHDIVTSQARQSFRNAQIAMAAGLLILIVAAAVALWAKTTTAAIVSGVLGGTGAALAGYIGRTFIRSQESAAEHLRTYFIQPQEFSRYLSAERLLNLIDKEEQAPVIANMIQGLIANGHEKPPSST